jgi:cell shape-determining protein MreC
VLACLALAALPPRARDGLRGALLDLTSRVPLGAPGARAAVEASERERTLATKLSLSLAERASLERALEDASAVRELTAAWEDAQRIPAEVVFLTGPESLRWRLVLGRGARDGVRPQAPVLSGAALVGVVAQTTRERSEVTLETDPTFKLRAVAPRASVEGMLRGNGEALLIFEPNCTAEEDPGAALQPGDVLEASRASSLCSLPAIVGTVRETLRRKGESFTRALVEPAVSASRLDSVVVVTQGEPTPELAGAAIEPRRSTGGRPREAAR